MHTIERFHGRGRAVLTSSDATQYSFEGDQLSGEAVQSVFTRHLVAGLRDGSADLDRDGDITLDELYSYVHDRVVAEIPRQRPRKQDEVKGRLVIARNVNWTPPEPSHIAQAEPPALRPRPRRRRAAYLALTLAVLAATVALVGLVGQGGPAPSGQAISSATGPQPVAVLRGHTNGVSGLAFSPDGKALATVGGPRAVRLWNIDTGQTTLTISPKDGGLFGVAFSPDGKTIATCGHRDGTVRIWDTDTGKLVRTLSGHKDWVYTVAFSPDGKTLASGAWDVTARLWDVATGRATAVLRGHTGDWPSTIYSVAFSPDGKILATGGSDQTARLWDVPTGRSIATLAGHEQSVDSLAFSSDGKTLATAGDEQKVRLWNVATRQASGVLAADHRPQRVAFNRDGLLAAGESEQTVQLWDLADNNRVIHTFTHRSGRANGKTVVAFSPDGNTLVTGDSDDGIVRLWKVTR